MKAGFALRLAGCLCLLSAGGLGCGSTQQREATEQLLTSNAVDRSIAQIDFRALSGQKVYFDTTYLKNIKGVGFVNAEYITSSLRQQLVAARCLLQDKKEDAEYVVEARIGTLGTDRHEVTYGMPANNFLNAASSLVPNSPPLPTLPELAVAKRNEQLAAVKIGAFAYHRETGEPVWQSGVAPIRSETVDNWFLGAGPFQRGDIHGETRFAGTKLGFSRHAEEEQGQAAPLVDYHKPAHFNPLLHQLEKPEETEEPAKVASKPEEPEKPKKKPEAKSEKKSEPEPEPKKSEPVPEPKPAPPEPATAAKPTPKAPVTPIPTVPTSPNEDASTIDPWDDGGLRLRFRFEDPPPLQLEPLDPGDSQLFRLDPAD